MTPDRPQSAPAGEACRWRSHSRPEGIEPCDCEERLAAIATHNRAQYGNDPAHCQDCSAAVQEWVTWDACLERLRGLAPAPPASESVAVSDVETLCILFHDAYEAAAAEQGWETQERSRKPWAEVPEANKETMRTTIAAVLAAGYISPTEAAERERAAREQALTEAAQEAHERGDIGRPGCVEVWDWLRDRAARIGES